MDFRLYSDSTYFMVATPYGITESAYRLLAPVFGMCSDCECFIQEQYNGDLALYLLGHIVNDNLFDLYLVSQDVHINWNRH